MRVGKNPRGKIHARTVGSGRHTDSAPESNEEFVGMSVQQIYERLAARAGLYGQAFFGHKRKPGESRKLMRLASKSVAIHEELNPVKE